ncbi:MAG: c-type cytochrome [bacterium]
MEKTTAKKLFWWGTLISAVIFLALTYDTLKQIPERTDSSGLTPQVVAGKWVWQEKNCNDCHTILGIGGYYAPDLTKEGKLRSADWLKKFLKDPRAVMPEPRQMPNQHLTDQQIDDLVAFLQWVSNIHTNGWPPKPEISQNEAVASETAEGKLLFSNNGCSACHKINGMGGTVGPDLSHVGSVRTPQWIAQQITEPTSHYPNSIMPSFKTLSKTQLDELVNYFSNLK